MQVLSIGILKRYTLLLSMSVAVLIIFSNPAGAASTVLPDSLNVYQFGDTGASVQNADLHLEVARWGNGNSLHAPTSWAKFYFDYQNGNEIRIVNADWCAARPDTINSPARTIFYLYQMINVGGFEIPDTSVAGTIATLDTNNFGCVDQTFTAVDNLNQSTKVGHAGQYIAYLRAYHVGPDCPPGAAYNDSCGGGVNAFRLIASDGPTNPPGSPLAGYYDQQGRRDDPYTPNGTQSFSIQDRDGPSGAALSDYVLEFAPDCDLLANETIYLKWYDDDWGGVQTNADFEFVVREYNSSGTLVRTTTHLPRGGNQPPGELNEFFAYTVKPEHKYTWTWYNVHYNNGIQIWMPYDSYNVTQDCPPQVDYQGEATSDCSVVNGYFGDLNDPADNSFDVRVQTRIGATGAISTTWDETPTAATPDSSPPFPDANDSHGYSVNIPVASMDTDIATQYRVHGYSNDRTAQLLDITNGWQSIGPCLDEWDYDVTLYDDPAIGADVRADDIFTIRSLMLNNGDGRGDRFDQWIRVRQPGVGDPDWWTNALNNIDIDSYAGTGGTITTGNGSQKRVIWEDRAANDGGVADPVRRVDYSVKTAPFHNQEICFESRITPAAGVSAPALSSTDTWDLSWDVNDPGGESGHPEDQVYTECVTTYNRRFAFGDINTVIPGPALLPGQPSTFTFTVFNNGTPPDNATLGPVGRNVNVSFTATGATIDSGANVTIPSGSGANAGIPALDLHDVDITVNDNVQPGDEVCVEIAIAFSSGYSDGDRSKDDPADITEEHCVVVAELPYFTVADHDVWAGGVWDVGTTCSNPGADGFEGDIKSVIANINGTNFGGFGEYAAFAIQQITNFGTREWAPINSGVPGGDDLAFANTGSPLGQLKGPGGQAPPKCIHDYFNKLYDTTLLGGPNINSINSNGEETLVYNVATDGPQVLNNASIRDKKTVVIKGDLFINGDITLPNNNVYSYDSTTGKVTGPMLAIVVEGNIYIDNAVEEINAILIAQPDSAGVGGIIETCATGAGAPIRDLTIANSNCGRQLTVKGAVIAEKINLSRSYGGVIRDFQNTQNGGAEEFIFDPMIYMNHPLFNDVTGVQNSEFPFLLIKDLPPVY